MASFGPELTGISLSVLGWMMSVVSCALPIWRVFNFVGANIITAQTTWKGLWMTCVVHSTGQRQCKIYDSLALPEDLQVARALSVVAIIIGVLGIFMNMVGAKCTNCIQNERVKARLMASSGGVFITAALVQLVLVYWSAHTIQWESSYFTSRYDLVTGVALHLGRAASFLMLIGGSILCCICSPEVNKKTIHV